MGCATTLPEKREGIYDENAIEKLAQEMFPEVVRLGAGLLGHLDEDWQGRSCGVLSVRLASYGEGRQAKPLVCLLGGQGGNYENRSTYMNYAVEKTHRLNRRLDAGEMTSWESRDPDKDRWGGAIVVPLLGTETILSFSGIPEIGDEAFMLLLAQKYDPHEAVKRRCEQILQRTDNEYYGALAPEMLGISCHVT